VDYENKRGIITALGKNKTGILAGIANVLAEGEVNILDITQTIIEEFFVMIMLIDLETSKYSFPELKQRLKEKGRDLGMQVMIQHSGIFESMHRI